MKLDPQVRRDLTYFLAGPGLLTLAIALLFHLHPWPTALKVQADNFSWMITGWWVGMGALAVALSSRVGCPGAPSLDDGRAWRRILLWGLGLGLLQAAIALAKNQLPGVGAHYEALDRAAGFTWGNVGLPWSLPHYFHASVLSECFYRFVTIVIPLWLISRLLLKGRFEAPLFWLFAVLSALIEPFQQMVLVKHMSFANMSLLDIDGTIEGLGWELLYAWTFRRFGWPAPILMRFGWYLLFRVTAGYFYPHTSTMYPGPH